MLLWLLIALLAALAGLWAARPFLRGGIIEMDEGDGAISVYRDRLDELERDLAAGMISGEESDQARREIERRALRAARRMGGGFSVSQRSLPGGAAPFVLTKFDETARLLGLDLLDAPQTVGGPTQDDIAAASDLTDAERDDMIGGMVAGLAAKLEEAPDNPDGWIMLVRSYVVMGEPTKAREALSRATEHFAGNATVLDRLQSEAASVLSQ